MDVLSYHIVIKTQMGYRVGDISLDIDGDNLSGTLAAPFFEPAFSGKLNEDSTMSLNVAVVYDEKREEYVANGRISGYAIHISVPTEHFTYEIDVTASKTINTMIRKG